MFFIFNVYRWSRNWIFHQKLKPSQFNLYFHPCTQNILVHIMRFRFDNKFVQKSQKCSDREASGENRPGSGPEDELPSAALPLVLEELCDEIARIIERCLGGGRHKMANAIYGTLGID